MKLKHKQENIWGIKIKTSIIALETQKVFSCRETEYCLRPEGMLLPPPSAEWSERGCFDFFSRPPKDSAGEHGVTWGFTIINSSWRYKLFHNGNF